jgi:hypothetical protein
MIPNITRGTRVQGLLFYLWGPGRREEHTDPHLLAAWDGAGELADLEPEITHAGKRDFRHLAELLEIPVRAGRNPPRKPVWHCSVRADPTDPIMTDERWREIAAHVLAKTGLAPDGDPRAVRWLAMRHGADHIHIVATLVRQDRRTNWGRNDWPLAQAACRDLEDRYGLVRVGRPGQGTRSWPTGAEVNKAKRTGRPQTPREELRRRVRDAATVAVDENDFFHRLTSDGAVTVKLRPSKLHPGEITGYSVALACDTNPAGDPIFYGGGKLAANLSLTRLRTRWQPDTTLAGSDRRARQLHPIPAEIYDRAAALIADTATHIAAHADNPHAVAGTVAAAADLLAATAAAWEGTTGGPITRAAELFDRAAHEPVHTTPAATSGRGYPLRAIARLVNTTTRGSAVARGQRELKAMLRLIRTTAKLADAVADLRAAHERLHQAHAAIAAATALRAYTPPPATASQHAATTPDTPRNADLWHTTQPPPRRHR